MSILGVTWFLTYSQDYSPSAFNILSETGVSEQVKRTLYLQMTPINMTLLTSMINIISE